ncbi:MAG: HAD-IB family hydrolase [Spirochaetes bacterium]|nr:HAD-IB family hydrolase [Spirochaetota bacterium]
MSIMDLMHNLPDADIAFFDLDETLTDEDTDSLWASWRTSHELKGWAERAWLFKMYRDFRNGRLDIDEYMKYQRFRIGTLSADEFRGRANEFFEDKGRAHIYREAVALVGGFRERGCRTLILTAQDEAIAAPFAGFLQMDGIIANRFAIEDGRFTRAIRPYCFGEGKVALGSAYAERAGVPLSRCAFFGDSIYDAPFLDLAGFPFAVNPDPLLEQRAREKRWRVIRFCGGTIR